MRQIEKKTWKFIKSLERRVQYWSHLFEFWFLLRLKYWKFYLNLKNVSIIPSWHVTFLLVQTRKSLYNHFLIQLLLIPDKVLYFLFMNICLNKIIFIIFYILRILFAKKIYSLSNNVLKKLLYIVNINVASEELDYKCYPEQKHFFVWSQCIFFY